MNRVLLILNEGFEEVEAITPIDYLRRAGCVVKTVSTSKSLWVTGSHAIRIEADALLADEFAHAAMHYDVLLLPGGPGVETLRQKPEVLELVRRFSVPPLRLAAICAAPLVLADAGVLKGRTITSFPSAENELKAIALAYLSDRVVIDGNLLTSRGAGTAEEFSLALIAWLENRELSEAIQRRIVAR